MALNSAANILEKPLSSESGLLEQAKSSASAARRVRFGLCAVVWALAIYQLSETTADPDLFGHVAFGQRILKSGMIQMPEIYSWTAKGQSFINHEYGAELILGAAHLALGGSGLLLLKVAVGLLTFGVALRLGSRSLSWPASAVTLVMGLVAIVEISFGFAARPQIFTALSLVLLLALLRRVHEGKVLWALAIPVLFATWINLHGGVLAGMGLLVLAATASTVELMRKGFKHQAPSSSRRRAGALWRAAGESSSSKVEAEAPRCGKSVIALWLASAGAIAALLCNPWGWTMVRWLVGSVLWLRPEIEEWNPTPLGWDHASLFFLVAASAFAWAFSRRRRALWELAVTCAFAALALRSVRNAPLFAVVALSLTPPHLLDALIRFKEHFERLIARWHEQRTQDLAVILLLVMAGGISIGVFTLHKEHPLTMEVPRSQYPTAAMDFIRAHDIKGNALMFFDWGEMMIFQLPGCSPSIDGRLDTCYSKRLIAEQWKLYNAEPVDQMILPIDGADFALLPSRLAGTAALRDRPGWKLVYFDNTAAVLVREPQRFGSLKDLELPVQGGAEASTGRAEFPGRVSGRQ
jgi:hypothetical protein